MKLIVGLGNPGKEYEATRHNIGFKAIDAFAHSIGVEVDKKQKDALVYKGKDFVLAKPQKFMNLSGEVVQKLAKFYSIDVEDILVVYDDMDHATGVVAMKPKGSSGGQNGIKNIIQMMGTEEIKRMKIGIGRPKNGGKNHVLGKFSQMQLDSLNAVKDRIVEGIKLFVETDFITAMNKINSEK